MSGEDRVVPGDHGSPVAKRHRKLIACVGKEPFDSRGMANIVNRRRSGKGVPGNVYKCVGCGKYHIGNPAWARG